jgi:hypothetical protein
MAGIPETDRSTAVRSLGFVGLLTGRMRRRC